MLPEGQYFATPLQGDWCESKNGHTQLVVDCRLSHVGAPDGTSWNVIEPVTKTIVITLNPENETSKWYFIQKCTKFGLIPGSKPPQFNCPDGVVVECTHNGKWENFDVYVEDGGRKPASADKASLAMALYSNAVKKPAAAGTPTAPAPRPAATPAPRQSDPSANAAADVAAEEIPF